MSLIFLAAISSASILIYERTNSGSKFTSRRVNDQEAVRVAEAGIEKAVWCLNNLSNTTDCPNNPNFIGETGAAFGRGSYTSVVSGSGNTRTIDVTGVVSGSGGTSTKQLRVKLKTTTTDVAFQYGVQAGIGGFDLSNNAFVTGNIYSAGNVTGSNGSYITGDAFLTASSPVLDQVSDPAVSPLTTINFATNGSTNDWVAQSFVPTITDRVYSLDVKLARVLNPTATLTAYIYSNSSGNPGSNLTAGGKAITVTLPSASTSGWENGWTNQVFTPSTNPILTAGTTYWLVIRSSGTNTTNYFRSVVSTTDATYPSGTAKLDGDGSAMPTACSPACDIAFRVNMGGVQPTLSLPSVQGDARAYTINGTTMTKKAYYRNVSGTVRANSTDTCTDGENGPNCFDLDATGGSDPAPVNLPISESQVTQMEAQAALGGTTNCSTACTVSTGNIGPRKYDGNLTINGNVTLTGTIWVKGDLTVTNNAIITLASGYGASSGVIIADDVGNRTVKGKITLSNNVNLVGNGTTGTYIMVISMYENISSTPAIAVSNNLSAGVVYAPLGIVDISNNANLKEVTAQKIVLQNNASVTYETGLASVNFSSGPGGSWTYDRGTYQIID